MNTTAEAADFSLVLGGPLFQLYRRAHLSGDALELLHRRVLVIPLFAWLPLLALSLLDAHGFAGAIKIPFLYDVEAHVRFLIALPLLIVAEVIVHPRVSHSVRQFLERRIVVAEDLPRFRAAVDSALRARNSVALEGLLVFLVYTAGLWVWRNQVAFGEPTWYAAPQGKQLHLTLAGYWYAWVSIPIFQFILMRWYVRLVLWFRLLWQISRLNLHLTAAHPDRAGGIGFLGENSYAFGPLLFAQGALQAGVIASRVLYGGEGLASFKMQAVGFAGFFVLVILGPLLMFTPKLAYTRRRGLAEYGVLANQYLFGFENRWMSNSPPETCDLLGAADLQSLADLGNSYSLVRTMRVVPFGLDDVVRLAATAAVPLVPLLLTVFSVGELLKVLVKILFR